VRTGEALKLKVIILSETQPTDAVLYWREMGKGTFQEIKLAHVARGVYSVQLPALSAGGIGFEYNIRVTDGTSKPVYYPAAAPDVSQTVIVMPS
jgi:hypothetical protein